MPVDAWFPLAVYYADLAHAAEHKERLRTAVIAYYQASSRRNVAGAAWTGDIHSVAAIHLDPAFDWLTEQVESHAAIYLQALGHNLNLIDLYIQRSWPVVSEPGRSIAAHSHPTAHISAAYYLSVPSNGPAGRIRFLNESKPNELSPKSGTTDTQIYAAWNPLNFQTVAYTPVEGRLLLFPAKQTHDVEPNQAGEQRLSVSYDIVMVAREDANPGLYEFLTPPLSQWRRCKQLRESPQE